MADMDCVTQVESSREFRDVGRVGVHIIPRRCLGRAAVTTPVMRDYAIALLEEEHHLAIPVVRAEWPPVVEDDRLSRAPVLVEDLGAILRGNRGHSHHS